jgi:hypothetical protein
MATTIDHLSADRHVRVIRPFHDARGHSHEAGESGVIRRIELDFGADEIVIHWERDGSGAHEAMPFALKAREGPRNGRMKEYFEAGDFRPEPRPLPPRPTPPPPQPVIPVPVWADPGPAVGNFFSLAAHRRFDEARAQLTAILRLPHPMGSCQRAHELAGEFAGIAEAYALAGDWTVYDWLKDQIIHLWYHWGAGATSGGEGTARRYEIDQAERRFAEFERRHRTAP